MLLRLMIAYALVFCGSPWTGIAFAQVDTLSSAETHYAARRKRKRVRKPTPPKAKSVPIKEAPKAVPVKETPKPQVKAPEAKPTTPVKAVPKAKPGIAIKDLASVHGVAEGVATILNELMLTRLKSSGRFSSVIGGSDMAAMIDLEAQKQALGCDEESCLAELGGALGVPFMLSAHLAKIGSRYVVTMKIISIEEAKVVVREVATAKNEDGLLDVVDALLSQTMNSLLGEPASSAKAAKAENKPEMAAPPLRGARGAANSPALKWSGLALSVGGAGWATYAVMRWNEQQRNFDDRSAWNSDVLADLDDQSKQTNTALAQGLGAAGLGMALAWWGW